MKVEDPHTLMLFAGGNLPVHPAAAWYLADLGEFRGRQELYTRQSPQRLKALREHALIESAVSSNRIEGVAVEPSRIREILVAPRPLFRDCDEEEVRGYRDALAWIHAEAASPAVSEETIQRLHLMARGQIADAGHYKDLLLLRCGFHTDSAAVRFIRERNFDGGPASAERAAETRAAGTAHGGVLPNQPADCFLHCLRIHPQLPRDHSVIHPKSP